MKSDADFSNFDCFSFAHGPIESKIWLCDVLRNVVDSKVKNVFILGSWNGVLPLLMYATKSAEFDRVHLVDLNEVHQIHAQYICDVLECTDSLRILVENAETVVYPEGELLVINTSTDNMPAGAWFDNIPTGTIVALQGRTGGHVDCVQQYNSLVEFDDAHPMSETYFTGEKVFNYPDHSYTRFMKIGKK